MLGLGLCIPPSCFCQLLPVGLWWALAVGGVRGRLVGWKKKGLMPLLASCSHAYSLSNSPSFRQWPLIPKSSCFVAFFAVPEPSCPLWDTSTSQEAFPPRGFTSQLCRVLPSNFKVLITSTSSLCSPRTGGGRCLFQFPSLLLLAFSVF